MRGEEGIIGAFEASTHDRAAGEKVVSGEDAEMISAEEFFKDVDTNGRLNCKSENQKITPICAESPKAPFFLV